MPSSVKRGWSWGADSRTPSPSESTHQAALVWKQYSSASSRGVAALAPTVSRSAAQSVSARTGRMRRSGDEIRCVCVCVCVCVC